MFYMLFDSHTNQREKKSPAGFTLIETLIVIATVILLTGVGVPSFKHLIASNRLQEVAWQMVQDLRTVKEDAILYQQDLNVYFDFDNSPVEPHSAINLNNREYFFETFQWGKDQNPQVDDSHYLPTDSLSAHFKQTVLKYNVVIDSISSTASSIQIPTGGTNYFVICFRSGAGSTFRGEGDVVTAMTGRTNTSSTIIDDSKLVIKLKDPSSDKAFYVIVEGTGKVSMYGSPP